VGGFIVTSLFADALDAFIAIPSHQFLMGTPEHDLSHLAKQYGGTRESYREESPQHTVSVAAYAIGRTPVSVAAYAHFVAAGGTPPSNWLAQSVLPDHPVVNVTWPMAQAFARWAGLQLQLPLRLPTESEWEAAARGTDGRQFPWGNTWDATAAAVKERGLPLPAVASFPHGASPWGCLDMAGTVWEWTQSLDALYPYQSDDGRNHPDTPGRRIIRGGCYVNPHGYARTACRFRMDPVLTNPFLGMRLAYTT
jgi:formylglycine-generating enzyme required for sulfatase activity